MTSINKSNANKEEKRNNKMGNMLTLIVLSACLVFIVCTFFVTAERNDSDAANTATITICSGDTLSSIAHDYCSDLGTDDAISEIMRLNCMESTAIYAGQELLIPVNN